MFLCDVLVSLFCVVTYVVHKVERFVNKDEGDETSEYFLGESRKILDKKTSLKRHYHSTDHYNPHANPDAPHEEV